MRKRKYRNTRKNPLEDILWLVLKPPTWLIIAGGVLFVGSIFFHYDYFYWVSKLSQPYMNKVIKFITDIISVVVPK